MTIHYITGPPGSGKTTYVAQHRQPNELVLDFDALCYALGSDTDDHHTTRHPQLIRTVARTVWRSLADTIARQGTRHNVWIIHATPDPYTRQTYASRGVLVDLKGRT